MYLKMMAGFVVVSMWAAAREEFGTTHWKIRVIKTERSKSKIDIELSEWNFNKAVFTWADGPQKTLTKANWDGDEETVLVSPWKKYDISAN